MSFKKHPYYDWSDRADWLTTLDLVEGHPTLSPERFASLTEVIRREKDRLCALGLEHIKKHVPQDYLTERPHPEVNEFLFCPSSRLGFQVYITYFFFQSAEKNSPDSDYWWVIVNCPLGVPPIYTVKQVYYVIGQGWYVS